MEQKVLCFSLFISSLYKHKYFQYNNTQSIHYCYSLISLLWNFGFFNKIKKMEKKERERKKERKSEKHHKLLGKANSTTWEIWCMCLLSLTACQALRTLRGQGRGGPLLIPWNLYPMWLTQQVQDWGAADSGGKQAGASAWWGSICSWGKKPHPGGLKAKT